jgi:transposase
MGSEVIEVVERRRSWPTETKLTILMESLEPGATISATADRHGVARGLVYTWMRLARAGRMPGLTVNRPLPTGFVPVRIEEEASRAAAPPAPVPTPEPARPVATPRRTSLVEITLSNGRCVKVDEGIDPATLAAIVAALDGTGLK